MQQELVRPRAAGRILEVVAARRRGVGSCSSGSTRSQYFRDAVPRRASGCSCTARVEAPARRRDRRGIVHPDVTLLDAGEELDALPALVPVYEKPTAMPVGVMRRIVQARGRGARRSRARRASRRRSPRRQRLVDPARALRHVHQPPAGRRRRRARPSATSLAHRSLIFDELFFLQLGLALRRRARRSRSPASRFRPRRG